MAPQGLAFWEVTIAKAGSLDVDVDLVSRRAVAPGWSSGL